MTEKANRIIREERLTEEEAAKYKKIRDELDKEKDELISRNFEKE